MPIYEQASLISTRDKFFVVPSGSLKPGTRVRTLDRKTGRVGLEAPPTAASVRSCPKRVIYGVVGLVECPGQLPLLVVITRKVRVGEIRGHVVSRIESVEIVDIKADADDDDTADLIKKQLISVFSTPYFYYSYTTDLSKNQQKVFSESEDVAGNKDTASSLDLADKRFIWNQVSFKMN